MWRGKQKPGKHIEHKAGDRIYADFTGKKMHVTDPLTGVNREFTSDELIAHLVQAEWDDRYNKRLQRLLYRARFRYPRLVMLIVGCILPVFYQYTQHDGLHQVSITST